MNKCKCKSYNRPQEYQTDNSLILKCPLVDRPFGSKSPKPKEICVDKCISKVINHLWKHNVSTKSSCCGHKYGNPEIVLDNNTHEMNADIVRKLIKEIDNREFELYSWKLTKL